MSDIINKIRARVTVDMAGQSGASAETPPTDHSKIAAAIEKIRAAGFSIQLLPGDKLLISPRTKLTDQQVAWITQHKPAILAYLRSLADPIVVKGLQEQFGATVQAITLDAPPAETPEPPKGPVLVRCMDCLHGSRALPGDELASWRLCEAGHGGFFALKRRNCDGYSAKP